MWNLLYEKELSYLYFLKVLLFWLVKGERSYFVGKNFINRIWISDKVDVIIDKLW